MWLPPSAPDIKDCREGQYYQTVIPSAPFLSLAPFVRHSAASMRKETNIRQLQSLKLLTIGYQIFY